MGKNEIIDFCLDNDHLSESELVSSLLEVLSNKKAGNGYLHDDKNVFVACGLTESTLLSDGVIDFPDVPEEKQGKVSMIVEYLETKYSPRELAFLFVQAIKAFHKASELLNFLR